MHWGVLIGIMSIDNQNRVVEGLCPGYIRARRLRNYAG